MFIEVSDETGGLLPAGLVEISGDGETVSSITVRTQEGQESRLRLGDEIDPLVWSQRHFQGHQQKRTQIGVKYKSDEKVAIELFE